MSRDCVTAFINEAYESKMLFIVSVVEEKPTDDNNGADDADRRSVARANVIRAAANRRY